MIGVVQKKTMTTALDIQNILCHQVVGIHRPCCESCQAIPISNIRDYIEHCIHYFKMKAFRCADIMLLHAYTRRSGGVLPESQANLKHFWNTGKIPTSNLQYLKPSILISSTMCDICNTKLMVGTGVFTLQCGHVFHGGVHSGCSLLAWLEKTNVCPKCDMQVSIAAGT